jgi:O-antigen/teichoic acid export membrane protein
VRFLKSGATYAIGNATSAAVPFLLLPLLTRMFGPAEYARIVNFGLLVTFCTAFAGLNMHAALGVVRFQRPESEVPAFTGNALALIGLSTATVTAIVALLAAVFPALFGGLGAGWAALAVVTAGSNVVQMSRLVMWQSQHRAAANVTLQVFTSMLNVSLSLVAVLLLGFGGDGRNGAIAVASIASACIAFGHFVLSREVEFSIDRRHVRTLLVFGAPLIVHTVAAVVMSSADRWTVSAKLGPAELGVYGAGAQLGMVMSLIADAFVKAYSPWLYGKLASNEPADRRYAVGAIYTAMPAFVVLAAVVGVGMVWLSAMLLGERYRAATAVLPWFMLGGAFTGIYVCTSVLFFFSGRTALLAAATSSAAVLGSLVTWILVSNFGVRGASMGFASTQAMLAIFTTALAMRSFDLPWREPAKAIGTWWHETLGSLRRQAA